MFLILNMIVSSYESLVLEFIHTIHVLKGSIRCYAKETPTIRIEALQHSTSERGEVRVVSKEIHECISGKHCNFGARKHSFRSDCPFFHEFTQNLSQYNKNNQKKLISDKTYHPGHFTSVLDNPYLVGNYPRHVAVKFKFSMFRVSNRDFHNEKCFRRPMQMAFDL